MNTHDKYGLPPLPKFDRLSSMHADDVVRLLSSYGRKCARAAIEAALKSQDAEDARWLVFNVGCIECGVSSDVVGVFATEEEAKRVAAICSEALSWREGGQNSFEVFDLQSEQASEYSKAIDHARRVEGGGE